MTGKELFAYYKTPGFKALAKTQREINLFNNIPYIILNFSTQKKIEDFLERWDREKLDLIRVFEACGEKEPANAEYLGEIMDGGLYCFKPKDDESK